MIVFIGSVLKDDIRNNVEPINQGILKWAFELIIVKRIPFIVVGKQTAVNGRIFREMQEKDIGMEP